MCEIVIGFSIWAGAQSLTGFAQELNIHVRDSATGYGVPAAITWREVGPSAVAHTVRADKSGIVRTQLTIGHYMYDVSASGYRGGTTHFYHNADSVVTPLVIHVDPIVLPQELRDAANKQLPGLLLVHGYVVHAQTFQPLEGVRVHSDTSGREGTTNERGYFSFSVVVADRADDTIQTDSFTVSRTGFRTVKLQNEVIGPGAMQLNLDLTPGSGTEMRDDTHKLTKSGLPLADTRIPPPLPSGLRSALFGTHGRALATERGSAAPFTGTPVPSLIRVGFNCTASVCTSWNVYTLEYYVQNGLDDEWISSWDANALKAGAIAYRSYGAYYVDHPIATNYDICSNTYCQVFNPTTRKNSTAAAANETVSVVLTRGGEIFRAEYAAEGNLATSSECPDGQVGEPSHGWPCMTDFICTGKSQATTHSRGMCQWGTQRWATGKDGSGNVVTTPRDWRCIVDHYYNDNNNSTGAGDPTNMSVLRSASMQSSEAVATSYGLIAYDGNFDIITMNLDGSGRKTVTRNGLMPTWSPAGDKLAFSFGPIEVVNSDGSGRHTLTAMGSGNSYPNWLPKGGKIVFASTPAVGQPQIYSMNEDGSGIIELTSTGYNDQPAWSPDGTKIAFVRDPGGSCNQVYLMNSDGSNQVPLTPCSYNQWSPNLDSEFPSWSPNGLFVAYSCSGQCTDSGDESEWYAGEVYLMNPDGSGKQRVTFSDYGVSNFFPSWTQDGKKIVFGSDRDNFGRSEVYIMNADGSNQTRLTSSRYPTAMRTSCRWCPRFDMR